MLANLRGLVAHLRQQGQLLVVEREVDPRFELNAVLRRIQSGPNLPVLFERVRGTRFPVFSNALGNYGIVAHLLGVEIGGVAARWAELSQMGGGALAEEHAAETPDWQKVSLDELPHITFCEKDAGPYITAGVVIARDPESAVVNLSYHRLQMIGPEELRGRLSTSGDLFRIQQYHEAHNEPVPVVIAIGLPPPVMLAGGATIGPDRSEYELAARIAGKRFPLVPSPGHGLPVPASTEILIEAEILPGVRRPEGPFGEWMGYYVPQTDNHVFRIRQVHARRDAMFYAIGAGSPEEATMVSVAMAGRIYSNLRVWVPSVRDVSCFPLTQFCAVQIKKQFEGQAQKALLTALGAEQNHLLYCVVVDEDVDIHDWRDVLWAMATRCRPDRDTFQIPGVPSFARDPHKMHWGRLGIDATKPLEHAADFERKTTPGLNEIRWQDYVRDAR